MKNNNLKKRIICSPLVHSDTAETLVSMGFEPLPSFENNAVANPLKYHADIQLCAVSNSCFVSSPECFDYYKSIIDEDKILCGITYLSCNYPEDIAYNILADSSCAIGNFKYTDPVVLDNLKDKKLINISQGYSACTLCRISDKAYITSDRGIYKTLLKEGFDMLLIDPKGIILKGYDCGFIGGSSVMLSDDTLGINGDIKTHLSYNDIKAFCLNYGVNVLSLSNKPIEDIGSFVII